ncbi:MAG: hypothetical protein JSS77_16125 [Acidobacteria bacterium]|nr:hypothetical protein [Acidobacteriota bacterium]
MLTPFRASRLYREASEAGRHDHYTVSLAYRQLAFLVTEQFRGLERMGMRFLRSDDPQPYHCHLDLAEDIKDGTMRVYAGCLNHPEFTDEENWMFRAVHDYFGHAMPGHPFDTFQGEVDAFRAHAATFPATIGARLALQAMAQEVVGQAGAFYMTGKYPVQHAGLFPLHEVL